MAFEQAAIKVEKAQEFGALQAAIEQAFRPERVEQFLTQLERKGVRIRNLDAVLAERVFQMSGAANAQHLYDALTVSDQALLREFYLSKLEEVDSTLRHKFKRLYQYY